ncbi:MAG: sigma-70 family RNA polymerase sigma factor [Planctomycetota bacterium]
MSISLEVLRKNDASAWQEAFRELWRVGWSSAKRRLPYDSPEQLEDLVSQTIGKEIVPQILDPKQEAFVRVSSFQEILNLTARIIANRAIDEIRRRTRRPGERPLENVAESDVAHKSDSDGAGKIEEVQLAVGSLDERYREVVEDFYFDELSTAEIAAKRGRPKGTICADLMKARRMLGDLLTEAGLVVPEGGKS